MAYQTHKITWRGLVIEARYDPHWVAVANMAHLEVISITPPRTPLPITDTGYVSYFHTRRIIETRYGGHVIAAVIDWLNEAAKCPAWKERQAAMRQDDLFA